jgi:hypothetical protein
MDEDAVVQGHGPGPLAVVEYVRALAAHEEMRGPWTREKDPRRFGIRPNEGGFADQGMGNLGRHTRYKIPRDRRAQEGTSLDFFRKTSIMKS